MFVCFCLFSREMWRKTFLVLISVENQPILQWYQTSNLCSHIVGCMAVVFFSFYFSLCECLASVCVYFTALPNLSTDFRITNEIFSGVSISFVRTYAINSNLIHSCVLLFAARVVGRCFFFISFAASAARHIARHSTALCRFCFNLRK